MMCPKGCKLTLGPRSCKAGQFGGRATDVHRCGSPFHFNRVLATFVLSFTPHIHTYFKQHTLSLINGTFLQGGSPNGSSAREVDMSLAVMSHLHHQLHLEPRQPPPCHISRPLVPMFTFSPKGGKRCLQLEPYEGT